MISAKKINHLDDLIKIKDDWDYIFARSSKSTIFQSFDWNLAWIQTFAHNKKLSVLIFYSGDTPIAVIPFYLEYRFLSIIKICRIIGNTQSDYNDIILSDAFNNHETKSQISKIIKDDIENFSLLYFNNLLKNSVLKDIILIGYYIQLDTIKAPYITLPYKNNFHDIFSEWSKKKEYNLIRSKKLLSNIGALEIKYHSDKDEIIKRFDDFFKMHSVRWNKNNTPTYSNKHLLDAFVQINDGRHNIMLSELLLDNKPVSFVFGFILNNKFYYYKSTFDIKYIKFSLGQIHIYELLKHFCEENFITFDFLNGNEKYKSYWTKTFSEVSSYLLKGDKLMGSFTLLGYRLYYSFIKPKLTRIRKLV